jgi:hypothetical protein
VSRSTLVLFFLALALCGVLVFATTQSYLVDIGIKIFLMWWRYGHRILLSMRGDSVMHRAEQRWLIPPICLVNTLLVCLLSSNCVLRALHTVVLVFSFNIYFKISELRRSRNKFDRRLVSDKQKLLSICCHSKDSSSFV